MIISNTLRYLIFAMMLFGANIRSVALAQSPELPEVDPIEQLQPNIVFVFTDDLGYGDIGAFGATDIDTPNIDEIAKRGALFSEFYSASPVCTPSRAALLTGRYPIRMGIHHVFFPGSFRGMPEDEITIAEILKEAGYATAVVGKWHLGHHEQYLPLNQGFDEFFGIPYSNDMAPLPLIQDNAYIEENVDQVTLTKRLTERATDFIDRHAGEPFFLYVPYPMPHVPLYRSDAFVGVSDRGVYGDVIQELDAGVGDIMRALDRNGITQNTLLVFTSDNGPWILMGKEGGSPAPLRNGKGTTFEGGIRVPTVAMYPDVIAPGQVVDAPASMLDWLPTLTSLAGASLPTDRQIDGIDLTLALIGDAEALNSQRPLAFYSHGKLEAIRVGDWKLKRPYTAEGNPVPGPLRLFLGGEIGLKPHDALLFNLSDDPGEQKNLAEKHPEKLVELESAMLAMEENMGVLPQSITPLETSMSPAVGVLISAAAKLGLIILAVLAVILGLFSFWFGKRSGRKGSR